MVRPVRRRCGAGPGTGPIAWSDAHDGIAPSPVVRGWLRVVAVLARPLVRRGVPAGAVTLVGVGLSAGAVVAPGPVAGALVGLAGLADGLDGAVARGSGTASARGTVLDRRADRASELFWLVALRPGWRLGALAAGGVAAVEGVRAGLGRPAVVTVAEKPNRVIVVGLALAAGRPRLGTLAVVGLSAAGVGQLLAGRSVRAARQPTGGLLTARQPTARPLGPASPVIIKRSRTNRRGAQAACCLEPLDDHRRGRAGWRAGWLAGGAAGDRPARNLTELSSPASSRGPSCGCETLPPE